MWQLQALPGCREASLWLIRNTQSSIWVSGESQRSSWGWTDATLPLFLHGGLTLLPGLRVSPNTFNIIPLSGQIQVKAGYPAVSICPFPSHYEADIQSCYLEKQQQNHLHGNFFIFIFGYGACLLLTSPRCSPGYPQNLHPACKLEGFKTTEIGHLLQALWSLIFRTWSFFLHIEERKKKV